MNEIGSAGPGDDACGPDASALIIVCPPSPGQSVMLVAQLSGRQSPTARAQGHKRKSYLDFVVTGGYIRVVPQ